MAARIPPDTAKSHALAMMPNSFLCTAGSGSKPKCTAPTHTQQQGDAVKDNVIPSSDLSAPGLAGRNLYLHPCCLGYNLTSWYNLKTRCPRACSLLPGEKSMMIGSGMEEHHFSYQSLAGVSWPLGADDLLHWDKICLFALTTFFYMVLDISPLRNDAGCQ